MADTNVQIAEVRAIVDEIWPTIRAAFAGHAPEVQGGVLADLVATWLAGFAGSDQRVVDTLRETLLQQHVNFVRLLVPINEALNAAEK